MEHLLSYGISWDGLLFLPGGMNARQMPGATHDHRENPFE